MTVTVLRVPSDTNSPTFVLVVAQARAAAIEHGHVVLESIEDGDRAYLIHDETGWRIEPATLLDPPAWTTKAMRIISRHG